ncbi:MAG: hypothetical protein K6G58_10735 [Lachnospiraceae bacterium]|nr:hypothetical protein [Lachnospiraceae bacterium]
MIVKFDHITYVAPRQEKDSILRGLPEPDFFEEGLRNLEGKLGLMKNPADDHDLYFFGSGYPTEYIFYDKVGEQSLIKLEDGTVFGRYSDREGAKDFLEGVLGCSVTEEDGKLVCSMKGVLDRNDYPLILTEASDGFTAYADDCGYGVPALIVNDGHTVRNRTCTEGERLTVGGKELEICFASSPVCDIIFELIKVKKK